MRQRKATITLEIEVRADMVPGLMYTFDDHVAVYARDILRYSYVDGVKLVSIEGDDVLDEERMLAHKAIGEKK